MLTVNNLSFSYGEVQALHNINIDVPQEQIVSIMGRNGVGKTTLMKNIVGLLKPSAGTIMLENKGIERFPAHKRIRAGIGYVPQGRRIFPLLTVEENLKIGLLSQKLLITKTLISF